MLHLEARISLVEVHEATQKVALVFPSVQVFQVLEPCQWDPLTTIAWKGFSLPVLEAAPILPSQSWSKMFYNSELSEQSLFNDPPHSQTHEYIHQHIQLLPNHKVHEYALFVL